MDKIKTKKQKFSLINLNNITDWDKWLTELDEYAKNSGYRKYNQNLKREDFAYWKTFDEKYQVGLFVYDFRNFRDRDPNANRIGIQFECMFVNIDSRIDLTVSKEIELEEFEKMAKDFYEAMSKYC